MTKNTGLTFLFLIISAALSSSAFALPSGSVSQLVPNGSKAYKMQLLQEIKLDRLIDAQQNFYANTADHIIDGKIMTEDEYYANYEGQSYCEINVFNFAQDGDSNQAISKLESKIIDSLQTKDSNWKDGAYNWATLKGEETSDRAYIAGVTCSYEGSIRARLKPRMSIEEMQRLLRGVVEISELK